MRHPSSIRLHRVLDYTVPPELLADVQREFPKARLDLHVKRSKRSLRIVKQGEMGLLFQSLGERRLSANFIINRVVGGGPPTMRHGIDLPLIDVYGEPTSRGDVKLCALFGDIKGNIHTERDSALRSLASVGGLVLDRPEQLWEDVPDGAYKMDVTFGFGRGEFAEAVVAVDALAARLREQLSGQLLSFERLTGVS